MVTWDIREVELHVIFDVMRKFRSRCLARALENNAIELHLTSKFGTFGVFELFSTYAPSLSLSLSHTHTPHLVLVLVYTAM